MKSKVKLTAIVLRTTRYSESSVVIHAFSETQGSITILAKGIRKKPEFPLIQRLNELEFILYEPAENGMFLYAECSLNRVFARTDSVMNMACAEAGVELVSHLMLPLEEIGVVYRLLVTYLEYIRNITKNEVAVFWRFCLRIMREMGVPLNLRHCGRCHTADVTPAGYDDKHGMPVCEKCLRTIYNLRPFSIPARRLLYMLPEIGRHLDNLAIGYKEAEEINEFLLRYLSDRFHKHFSLNSMHVALQLIRMAQNGSN